MAQQGRAPLISAWGFARWQSVGLLELCVREPRMPSNMPNMFSDFFLITGPAITTYTVTLGETVGGSGIFILNE
jgi:hypothetical protein